MGMVVQTESQYQSNVEAERMRAALQAAAEVNNENQPDLAVDAALQAWARNEERGIDAPPSVAVQDILIADDVQPGALDFMLMTYFKSALMQVDGDYFRFDGCYVIRCFGNAAYLAYALEQQGYARVARICEGTIDDEREALGMPT